MWITSSENFFAVCIDFEFVTCASGRRHVWEIGACVLPYPHIKFQAYIMPPIHPLPKCCTNEDVSTEWLRNKGAVSISQAMHNFCAWLEAHCAQDNILFCAHGAFGADQPLLREAIAQTGVCIPRRHFFLDTLQYTRHAFRADRLEKFTLAFLVERYLNANVEHNALSDASNLVRLLLIAKQRVPLSGYIVPTHCVPLTLVPGVGPGIVHELIMAGVPDNVEDLGRFFAYGCSLPAFVSKSVAADLQEFVRTVCEQPCFLQLPSFTACHGGTSTTLPENVSTKKQAPL